MKGDCRLDTSCDDFNIFTCGECGPFGPMVLLNLQAGEWTGFVRCGGCGKGTKTLKGDHCDELVEKLKEEWVKMGESL